MTHLELKRSYINFLTKRSKLSVYHIFTPQSIHSLDDNGCLRSAAQHPFMLSAVPISSKSFSSNPKSVMFVIGIIFDPFVERRDSSIYVWNTDGAWYRYERCDTNKLIVLSQWTARVTLVMELKCIKYHLRIQSTYPANAFSKHRLSTNMRFIDLCTNAKLIYGIRAFIIGNGE